MRLILVVLSFFFITGFSERDLRNYREDRVWAIEDKDLKAYAQGHYWDVDNPDLKALESGEEWRLSDDMKNYERGNPGLIKDENLNQFYRDTDGGYFKEK